MIKLSPLFRIRGILYSLFNKGIPYHKNENFQPFFIVGSGRCGTTLLRRTLNAAEGVHIPPENWALSRVVFKFRRLRHHMNWDTLVDLTTASHYQDTQGWFDSFPSDFVKEMREYPKEEQSLSSLINSIYSHHAKIENRKCKRWGDKTPLNIDYMELILMVFPQAKFIHMVRDGVDVVYSWKKHALYGNDILKPAQRWCSAINKANKFKTKYPKKILEVRYEDLVRNPSSTVKEVCTFLDINFTPHMLKIEGVNIPKDLYQKDHYVNVFTPISDEHIGKGRKKLSSNERRTLKKELNSKLKQLGYNPL